MTTKAVIVTRTFKAPPARVFAAFEDPAQMARWMGQPGSSTEVQGLDLREGGAVRVQMSWENGMSIRLYGTFQRVERPSLLRFTWAMEGDDANQGVVTVELRPHGTGTELTLTHEGLSGSAQKQSRAGWNGWFNRLQELVETGTP
ncbi:MAG: SRPBCC domain-containing protein [Gemmatimonadales bacterium]